MGPAASILHARTPDATFAIRPKGTQKFSFRVKELGLSENHFRQPDCRQPCS